MDRNNRKRANVDRIDEQVPAKKPAKQSTAGNRPGHSSSVPNPTSPRRKQMDDLPPELIEMIFSNLNTIDQLNFASTSTKINTIFSKSSSLMKVKLCIDLKKIEDYSHVNKRSYTSVKLMNCSFQQFDKQIELLKIFAVPSLSNSVKKLEISDFELLTGRQYGEFFSLFPKLECLKESRCSVNSYESFWTKETLKSLRILRCTTKFLIDVLLKFLGNNSRLKEITLDGIHNVKCYGINQIVDFIFCQAKLRKLHVFDALFFDFITGKQPQFQLNELFVSGVGDQMEIRYDNMNRLIKSQKKLKSVSFRLFHPENWDNYEDGGYYPTEFLSNLLRLSKLQTMELEVNETWNDFMMMNPGETNLTVKDLRIEYISLDDLRIKDCIDIAVKRFPNVESLNLSWWGGCEIDLDDQYYRSSALASLSSLRNLKHLSLCLNVMDEDVSVELLYRVRIPKLESLELEKVFETTKGNLLEFIYNHRNIKSLIIGDIDDNDDMFLLLSFALEICKNLKLINLNNTWRRLHRKKLDSQEQERVREIVDRFGIRGLQVKIDQLNFYKH